MTKKSLRIALFSLSAALVLLSLWALLWGFGQKDRAEAAELRLSGLYEKSLDELSVRVGEMEVCLSKLLVSATPRQAALLLSEIGRASGEAVCVLSQLPAAHGQSAEANRFLVETEAYARTLLEQVTDATPLSQSDLLQLTELHNVCTALSARLTTLTQEPAARAWVGQALDYYAAEEPQALEAAAYEADAGGEEASLSYPHLIYDGPFSKSTEKSQPLGLSGAECTMEEARKQAQAFVSHLLSGELTFAGEQLGRIPCYSFAGQTKDGETLVIDMTKAGGQCLSFRKSGGFSQSEKPDEQTGRALSEQGALWLSSRGFSAMEATYAQYYGGCAVINYAAVQEGVLLYNDLIKLWLDLETGEVVGFEAANYWFSHVPRTLPAPVLSAQEAEALLSPALSVRSVRPALIPLTPMQEALCYEFKCTYGEDAFVCYINAQSGREEAIFQIIDSENGQLVL